MSIEKRKGLAPIPHPVNFFLTGAQMQSIKVLRQFGWQLVCLRREDVPDILPILWNRTEQRPGALDPDGSLRTGAQIRLRSRSRQAAGAA